MTLSYTNRCLIMSNAALVKDRVLMQYLMAFKHLNLLTHTHTHIPFHLPFPTLVRLLFL